MRSEGNEVKHFGNNRIKLDFGFSIFCIIKSCFIELFGNIGVGEEIRRQQVILIGSKGTREIISIENTCFKTDNDKHW